MTFSNYKNNNTYKVLRTVPIGAITFISDLYAGGISDKKLTRRSGILQLLESGETYGRQGFQHTGQSNTPWCKVKHAIIFEGKSQLTPQGMVETRRIASARMHVERAME